MNKYKVYDVTRKELEKRNYTILDILNIYADCVEYKIETVGGYTKHVRVYE